MREKRNKAAERERSSGTGRKEAAEKRTGGSRMDPVGKNACDGQRDGISGMICRKSTRALSWEEILWRKRSEAQNRRKDFSSERRRGVSEKNRRRSPGQTYSDPLSGTQGSGSHS